MESLWAKDWLLLLLNSTKHKNCRALAIQTMWRVIFGRPGIRRTWIWLKLDLARGLTTGCTHTGSAATPSPGKRHINSKVFMSTYNDASFEMITPDNFAEFIQADFKI
jgi:hypothetical protein